MSLHSPLKLLVGGCGMITSCSIWLFDGQNPSLTESLTSNDSSSQDPIYLDQKPAVEKLKTRTGQAIKDENIESVVSQKNASITLKLKKELNKPDAMLSPITVEVGEFYVYGNSTKTKYQEFDRTQIKISLYKKAAWYSDTKMDEYEEIEKSKIEELFEGLEEVRVKQLLLALHQKVEWREFASGNWFHLNRYYANSLEDLKDLKIRYFSDFDKLREYVKEKVETCVDDTNACYPNIEELDYPETDRKEYMEKFWNSQ